MKRILCVMLVLILMATGCGASDKDSGNTPEMENKFEENEKNNEDVIKESSGQISYGYLDADTETYEYDGKDVRIPFYLENQGEENEGDANVGLLLFVDGNAQDYRLEENGKAEAMQRIVLKPKERKEIQLIFKPVSGKKGEKVGVIPAMIWNPDSLPDEKNPIWGNNQQLGANIPLEIDMKEDGTNELQAASAEVNVGDIPEEILEEYKKTYVDDVYDSLDASANFIMESAVEDKSILYAKEGKVPVTLKLYGGKNVRERITLFINNDPVKIEGKDYVEVSAEKGKMITVKADLDLAGCGRLNSIYAIVMTTGGDYKKQDIYKTDSCLLIDETALDGNKKETRKEQAPETLRIAMDDKKIICKDLATNEVVGTYRLNKKQCENSLIEFDGGYCARILEADRELKNQVVDGIMVFDMPDESEIEKAFIKIFDKGLKEQDTIDIVKVAKEQKCGSLFTTPFAVSGDGTWVVWDMYEYILCYNRRTKEFSRNKQLYEEDIALEAIAFAGNENLAFYGTKGNMEGDACYGYLDLSDKKIHSFIEKKYDPFSLYTDKRFIWLNDGEDPEDGAAAGKFVMVDTETGKNNTIRLDNTESTKARITEDGNCVIAICQTKEMEKEFRVRQYSAAEGAVLNEKTYKFSEAVKASDIIPIRHGAYGIIYQTENGEKMQEFICKED